MSKKIDDVWKISSDYSKVDPLVAAKIGVDAAIVLRTLYNLCRYKKLNRNLEWFQGTKSFWKTKFPWLSTSTLKRVMSKLEHLGLVEIRVDQQGNYYRVVESNLIVLLEDESNDTVQKVEALGQNEPTNEEGGVQNEPTSKLKMNPPWAQNEPTLLTIKTPDVPPMSPPIFAARPETAPKKTDSTPGSRVFEAYAFAYEKRYGCTPMRNQAINSIAKKIYEQAGEEAMALVQHYVGMNKRVYLEKSHALQTCLWDLQAVRTAFVTGKTMTSTRAAEMDKEQTFREVIYGIERDGAEEFELFEGVSGQANDHLASPKVLRERAELAARQGNSNSPALLCETVPVAKPDGNT